MPAKSGATVSGVVKTVWVEFTRNPRLYALFAAGPFSLSGFLWLSHVAAEPRWGQPLAQLDILKLAVVILGMTHMVVVVALAAVRVSGRGPGGFAFDVDGDGDGKSEPITAKVEGDITVTPTDSKPATPPPERE